MTHSPVSNSVDVRRIGSNEVVFTNVEGRAVPSRPWPQSFYVSCYLMQQNAVEVRPLTVTSLVKGLGRNFVTMTYWRFLWLLRRLGFLTTPNGGVLCWHDFTLRFWRHHLLHAAARGERE